MTTRLLLCLFLLLCGSSLRAQSTTTPPPEDCIFKSFWTPAGTGSDWMQGATNAEGVRVLWWGWWCPRPDGTWRLRITRCVDGRTCLSAEVVTRELNTASRSADPLAELRAAAARYEQPPQESELPAWNQARVDAVVLMAPLRPPSRLWVVAPNPSATTDPPTRPMFDPVTLKQVAERAPVGALCDSRVPAIRQNTLTLLPLYQRPVGPEDARTGMRASVNVTACVQRP
jgi:hypothetical protein